MDKESGATRIRPMDIGRDMHSVLGTEQASSENTTTKEELLRRLRRCNSAAMVAEQGGGAVGFLFWRGKRIIRAKGFGPKRGIHLISIMVRQEYRKQGIGARMVAELTSKLGHNRTWIEVEVPETNRVALDFFRSQGFVEKQVLQNVLKNGGNAILMHYNIAESDDVKPDIVV